MERQAVSSAVRVYVYTMALSVVVGLLAWGWDPVLLGAAYGGGVLVAAGLNSMRRDVFAPPDRPPAYRVVIATHLEDSRR